MSSISIRSSVVPAAALTVATSSPNAVPAAPIDPPAWKVSEPAPALTFTSLAPFVLVMSPVEASSTFDVVKSTSALRLMDDAVMFVASASEPITMLPPAAEISAISAADNSSTSLTVVAADPRSTACAFSDFSTTMAAPAFTPRCALPETKVISSATSVTLAPDVLIVSTLSASVTVSVPPSASSWTMTASVDVAMPSNVPGVIRS